MCVPTPLLYGKLRINAKRDPVGWHGFMMRGSFIHKTDFLDYNNSPETLLRA
jgi:hypothetical protein